MPRPRCSSRWRGSWPIRRRRRGQRCGEGDEGSIPGSTLRGVSEEAMSHATRQALELPSLLAVVAQFAASDLGRERVLALCPYEDVGELRGQRVRFEEASRLV